MGNIYIPLHEWKNIKKLKDSGLTYQKIADMYGVTRQSIQQGLAKRSKKIS